MKKFLKKILITIAAAFVLCLPLFGTLKKIVTAAEVPANYIPIEVGQNLKGCRVYFDNSEVNDGNYYDSYSISFEGNLNISGYGSSMYPSWDNANGWSWNVVIELPSDLDLIVTEIVYPSSMTTSPYYVNAEDLGDAVYKVVEGVSLADTEFRVNLDIDVENYDMTAFSITFSDTSNKIVYSGNMFHLQTAADVILLDIPLNTWVTFPKDKLYKVSLVSYAAYDGLQNPYEYKPRAATDDYNTGYENGYNAGVDEWQGKYLDKLKELEELQAKYDELLNNNQGIYTEGYNSGYTEGYAQGKNDGLKEVNDGEFLKGYASGEKAGYDRGYSEGYAKALNGVDGNSLAATVRNFVYTLFDAPVSTFLSFVNFEIDGFNVVDIATFLFTIAVVIALIRLLV